MRNCLYRRFLFFILIFVCLLAFPQKYRIGKISYSLEKTREQDLRRVVPVNTDRIFASKEELDSYLLDLKQRLMNTRAFDNVELAISNDQLEVTGGEVSPGKSKTNNKFQNDAHKDVGKSRENPQEFCLQNSCLDRMSVPTPSAGAPPATPPSTTDTIIPISLHISAQDTKHLLILPYPKYDSNDGLIFKIKVKDVNFLGTMNTMDAGVFTGLKEDVTTGEQNLTFGGEFKYKYPFCAGPFVCSWNNNFDLTYTRGVNELEFWTGTGLTFELPFKRVSFVLDVSEQANRDLEYEAFKDTQYFTSDANFSVPVKILDIDDWGFVYWTPFIDGKVSYDKDGINIKNDDLASPVVSCGQSVSTSRINWHGNFRDGISAKIGHSIGYDFQQEETEPRAFGEIQAFKGFKYIGFNTRFTAFVTKSNRGKIGDLIRGVRDKQKYVNTAGLELRTQRALKTPSALVLNIDIPVHIITTHWLDWSDFIFGEESWFSRTFAWTDKFNFELQASPFMDIALTKNEVTDRLFSPKDGWYTGGIEFLVFPEHWKGIVMRCSFGVDLGRAVLAKKYPEKIDMSWRENVKKYEIYAGIGLHY